MPSKRKPQDLKSLQATWYRKLKQSGFNDIEDTTSPNEMLKRWDSRWFATRFQLPNKKGVKVADMSRLQAKRRYYQLAESLLDSEHIKWPKRERKIWELHSQGLSLREIQAKVGTHYSTIHGVVKRYRKLILGK